MSKKCQYDGCNKHPSFNVFGEKNKAFCNEHKADDMVDVSSNRCLYEWCNTRANKKYDGYCLRCFIYTFPDRPVSRNYKTKEFSVVEFIKTTFPNYTWIADKTVKDGCSRRRPDLLLDFGDYVIIIEIDENQHIEYDCSCDNKRTMEISQDLGHRSIVFIRFNPDDYKNGDKKITSCWGANGNGICVVKKTKTKEWNDRLNSLKEQIEYWMNNKPDKMIEIIQLYYDN